jgi:hypothetical protein
MTEEAPTAKSFNAREVRAWLTAQGEVVGSRGRIAVSKMRSYLDANPERAREIARELCGAGEEWAPTETGLDAVALSMARPGLRGKVSEPVAETSAA